MFCIINLRSCNKSSVSASVKLVLKAKYSRRSSNDDMRTCIVNYNQEPFKNFDNAVGEYDPNWELLMPAGYRFYLPGSVGHGWSDAASTIRMKFHSDHLLPNDPNILPSASKNCRKFNNNLKLATDNRTTQRTLFCQARECPKLLRKDIKELFPAWLEVMFPELTIVTIIQKCRLRTVRWSKEAEIENLAKSFVLSASYICTQLRMARHWADFVNPFSGRPHMGHQKGATVAAVNNMYTTDERLQCLAFKIEDKNNCKIISHDKNDKHFIGSLYTTASPNSAFLQELMSDITEH